MLASSLSTNTDRKRGAKRYKMQLSEKYLNEKRLTSRTISATVRTENKKRSNMRKPKTDLIVVLNDGETFTALDGCKIVEVPEDMSTDEIEEALKEESDNIRTVGSCDNKSIMFHWDNADTPIEF